jgi:putative phage-type endonuclease
MSIHSRVKSLIDTYGVNDQRTDAWHAKRGEMLTASEIYKTIKDATPAARRELMMGKLTPRETTSGPGSRALVWGTQFEPIAKQIYESLHGIKIIDTSCVKHPEHEFLGASPDGIIVTDDLEDPRYGQLVEFKCPITRDFDDSTPVPTNYIHQMQLQMECTGLDVCQYAEFKFRTMNYSEWMDTDAEYKSAYILFEDGTLKYKDYTDASSFVDWKEKLINEHLFDPFTSQTVFWTLTKHKFQTVAKDPTWIETHLPYFQTTWREIQEHRIAGTFPTNPNEKVTLAL